MEYAVSHGVIFLNDWSEFIGADIQYYWGKDGDIAGMGDDTTNEDTQD